MCARSGAWSLQNTVSNNSSSSGLPVPPFGWPLPPSILRQNAAFQQTTDGDDQPLNLSMKTEDESSEKSVFGTFDCFWKISKDIYTDRPTPSSSVGQTSSTPSTPLNNHLLHAFLHRQSDFIRETLAKALNATPPPPPVKSTSPENVVAPTPLPHTPIESPVPVPPQHHNGIFPLPSMENSTSQQANATANGILGLLQRQKQQSNTFEMLLKRALERQRVCFCTLRY